MSFTTRLAVFASVAIAFAVAWHWCGASPDMTHLAVQQFHNDAAVPTDLQQASDAQNWWPLLWPALIVAVGVVMFWEDIERLWKHAEE